MVLAEFHHLAMALVGFYHHVMYSFEVYHGFGWVPAPVMTLVGVYCGFL